MPAVSAVFSPQGETSMQPFTAPVAGPAEDLDAVLGRFQDWSASRRKKEPADGVRELSYEEALQSSRYRWQSRAELAAVQPAKAIAPDRDAVRDEAEAAEPATPEPPALEDALAPDTVILSGSTHSHLDASASDTPALSSVFGTVLAEAVSPDTNSGPLALVWPAAGRPERQVSMSLRVAASEQALIKARAAEAGLSVSAYLRQCALEVEKLRAQVHHTLAMIESRSEQKAGHIAPAIQMPRDGFLARLRQRLFGNPRALTIRA